MNEVSREEECLSAGKKTKEDENMIHVRYYNGTGVAKIGELVDVVTIGDCERVVIRQDSNPRYVCLFAHDILGIYDVYDRDNSVENIKKHMKKRKKG